MLLRPLTPTDNWEPLLALLGASEGEVQYLGRLEVNPSTAVSRLRGQVISVERRPLDISNGARPFSHDTMGSSVPERSGPRLGGGFEVPPLG